MPPIKVAFFDIDGTLYSQRTNQVPPRARRAVAALRERGVKVVIATGRHPIELDTVGLDGMAFDGYAAANGQICLDAERTLIAGHPIPDEGARALARLFAESEEPLWFFGEAECYASREDEALMAMAEMTTGVIPPVRAYDGKPLYQAVAFVEVEDEPAFAALLPGCKLQRWAAKGVDIIAADGGKVAGMQTFLELYGASREECMAFGDQGNDRDMLDYAGVGVAMGNGSPEARVAADYVTSSVDDDGVARALEYLGLLEPGWDQ